MLTGFFSPWKTVLLSSYEVGIYHTQAYILMTIYFINTEQLGKKVIILLLVIPSIL